MKKKLSLSTVLIAVLIICGLGLILYPTLSDMYATWQYNKEIEAYNAERTRETAERNAKLWADAEEYNRDLLNKTEQFSVSSEELTRVEGLLNPLGNGMMGYVNIPKIDVALPVYQGTDEKELQSGASWKLIVGIALLLAIIAAVVYIITIIRRRKTESGQPAAAVEPEVPAAPPAETGGGTPPAPAAEAKLRPAAAAKRRAPTGYVGKHCALSGTRKESSRSTGKQ